MTVAQLCEIKAIKVHILTGQKFMVCELYFK